MVGWPGLRGRENAPAPKGAQEGPACGNAPCLQHRWAGLVALLMNAGYGEATIDHHHCDVRV